MRSFNTIRRAPASVALLLPLLLAVSAAPAHAQLGKLRKIGADAAKKAAEEKLTGKKDTASSASTTSGGAAAGATSASASPSATAVSYALSEDHIDLVLSALAPRVEMAKKEQALRITRREWDVKDSVSTSCVSALNKRQSDDPMVMVAAMQKNQAAIERVQAEMLPAQQRLGEALGKQDWRAVRFLEDTTRVLGARGSVLAMGGTCTVDFKPVALIEADLRSDGISGDHDPDKGAFDPSGTVKSKLTATQFGRMRERIALWALLQETPSLKVGKEGVFTEEEQAALAARTTEIKALTPYFRDSSLRWKTWGDVKSW